MSIATGKYFVFACQCIMYMYVSNTHGLATSACSHKGNVNQILAGERVPGNDDGFHVARSTHTHGFDPEIPPPTLKCSPNMNVSGSRATTTTGGEARNSAFIIPCVKIVHLCSSLARYVVGFMG